ncbi:hypothetical protein PVAND_005155 [Polypedilum vanderplanki]|uniref:Short neuropeptide F n=1 Tax=Polypedilum vanderplanki TaxID=319348 RepID=A0A9J6BZR0_POLVA|nr:hypothetical protein PVAND_005155 [Polypedilum vanderplanki]
MNQLNLIAISLVLIVSSYNFITAAPTNDDASVKAFYEYLLNREYAEPLALSHAMERKGVRSPSMRLRFGRRSDPDVPLIGRENEIDMENEQKRSPSMRLRFGRRNDPLMSLLNEEAMFYNDETLTRKAQRTPSVRLRFGKRSDATMLENEAQNELQHVEEN